MFYKRQKGFVLYARIRRRGITLIEVLVYMALLGALFSSSFAIVLTLGKEASGVQNMTERQVYSLAFFEHIRGLSADGNGIVEPMLYSSSSRFVTTGETVVKQDDYWMAETLKHKFIFTPQHILFLRNGSSSVAVIGDFLLTASSSKAFVLPLNTWEKVTSI